MEIDKFPTKLSLTNWQSLSSTYLKILIYLTTLYDLITTPNNTPHLNHKKVMVRTINTERKKLQCPLMVMIGMDNFVEN
jgi:hypothetical protein